MSSSIVKSRKGFTLMETVIAIVILAVLLTGFLAVFGPATQGIKKSFSSQQANRLTSTLERELVTLRETERASADGYVYKEGGPYATGFEKAFDWIKNNNSASEAILIYQYRGSKNEDPRDDGSLRPLGSIAGKPGVDYSIQSTARRLSDDLLLPDPDTNDVGDLAATDGDVFYVKLIQLVTSNDGLELGDRGEVVNPPDGTGSSSEATKPDEYTDAVITFAAEFYSVPTKSAGYLNPTSTAFNEKFNDLDAKPVFVRNLAIRR